LSVNNFIINLTGIPSENSLVKRLKLLQNNNVLKPCCPRKGPTGGCKLACLAGTVKITQRSKAFFVELGSNKRLAIIFAICSKKIFVIGNHL
jgi:hypothetical protein